MTLTKQLVNDWNRIHSCVCVCARIHIQVLVETEPRALCICASTLPLNSTSGMKLSIKATLLPHGL